MVLGHFGSFDPQTGYQEGKTNETALPDVLKQ
jgi:hypothetical protein